MAVSTLWCNLQESDELCSVPSSSLTISVLAVWKTKKKKSTHQPGAVWLASVTGEDAKENKASSEHFSLSNASMNSKSRSTTGFGFTEKL